MTWTYSGNPAHSDRDAVRFLVGDTDSSLQLASDQEIDWALANESVNNAAATIAEGIAASLSKNSDVYLGDKLRQYLSQPVEHYNNLAKRLRKKGTRFKLSAFAGGISVSDKENRNEDTDRVKPKFTVDMNTYADTDLTDDLQSE